jgi:hypothetical protein
MARAARRRSGQEHRRRRETGIAIANALAAARLRFSAYFLSEKRKSCYHRLLMSKAEKLFTGQIGVNSIRGRQNNFFRQGVTITP